MGGVEKWLFYYSFTPRPSLHARDRDEDEDGCDKKKQCCCNKHGTPNAIFALAGVFDAFPKKLLCTDGFLPSEVFLMDTKFNALIPRQHICLKHFNFYLQPLHFSISDQTQVCIKTNKHALHCITNESEIKMKWKCKHNYDALIPRQHICLKHCNF